MSIQGDFKFPQKLNAEFRNGVSGYVSKEKHESPYKVGTIGDFAYTGKEIKPDLSIKKDGKKLVKGTDYTLTYENNIEVGIATATARFTNDKYNVVRQTFRIVPGKPTLKAVRSGKTYKFTWSASKGCEKYQLQYSTDGGKTFKTLTRPSSSKTSYTVKLKSGSYVFRMRGYKTVDGTKFYSKWSKTVKI